MSLPTSATLHKPGADPADSRAIGQGNSPAAPALNDPEAEPILCRHCGRTASNGISCQGHCVADSGY
jgi:hypothetical protein